MSSAERRFIAVPEIGLPRGRGRAEATGEAARRRRCRVPWPADGPRVYPVTPRESESTDETDRWSLTGLQASYH